MHSGSIREKEVALRQIYNYINWILLHQKGLRSIQTSKGTRVI